MRETAASRGAAEQPATTRGRSAAATRGLLSLDMELQGEQELVDVLQAREVDVETLLGAEGCAGSSPNESPTVTWRVSRACREEPGGRTTARRPCVVARGAEQVVDRDVGGAADLGDAPGGAGFCVASFRSFSSSDRMSTFERTRTCFTEESGAARPADGWISAKLTSPAGVLGGRGNRGVEGRGRPGKGKRGETVERDGPRALADRGPSRAGDWRRWSREIVESKSGSDGPGAATPRAVAIESMAADARGGRLRRHRGRGTGSRRGRDDHGTPLLDRHPALEGAERELRDRLEGLEDSRPVPRRGLVELDGAVRVQGLVQLVERGCSGGRACCTGGHGGRSSGAPISARFSRRLRGSRRSGRAWAAASRPRRRSRRRP